MEFEPMYVSVSQGQIMCCHTEIQAADLTCYLTLSQYIDTVPTSPNTDPHAMCLAGYPLECQILSHWYDLTRQKFSERKWELDPRFAALKADALTTRPMGQWDNGTVQLGILTHLISLSFSLKLFSLKSHFCFISLKSHDFLFYFTDITFMFCSISHGNHIYLLFYFTVITFFISLKSHLYFCLILPNQFFLLLKSHFYFTEIIYFCFISLIPLFLGGWGGGVFHWNHTYFLFHGITFIFCFISLKPHFFVQFHWKSFWGYLGFNFTKIIFVLFYWNHFRGVGGGGGGGVRVVLHWNHIYFLFFFTAWKWNHSGTVQLLNLTFWNHIYSSFHWHHILLYFAEIERERERDANRQREREMHREERKMHSERERGRDRERENISINLKSMHTNILAYTQALPCVTLSVSVSVSLSHTHTHYTQAAQVQRVYVQAQMALLEWGTWRAHIYHSTSQPHTPGTLPLPLTYPPPTPPIPSNTPLALPSPPIPPCTPHTK